MLNFPGIFRAATACSVIAAHLQSVCRYGVRGLIPIASTAVLHIGLQVYRLPLRPLPHPPSPIEAQRFYSNIILYRKLFPCKLPSTQSSPLPVRKTKTQLFTKGNFISTEIQTKSPLFMVSA